MGKCGLEHTCPGEESCRFQISDWCLSLDVEGASREAEEEDLKKKPLLNPVPRSEISGLARNFSDISLKFDKLLAGSVMGLPLPTMAGTGATGHPAVSQ